MEQNKVGHVFDSIRTKFDASDDRYCSPSSSIKEIPSSSENELRALLWALHTRVSTLRMTQNVETSQVEVT